MEQSRNIRDKNLFLQLTYFDLKAEAEYLRLLLAAAGMEFEDNRLPMGSQEVEELQNGGFSSFFEGQTGSSYEVLQYFRTLGNWFQVHTKIHVMHLLYLVHIPLPF